MGVALFWKWLKSYEELINVVLLKIAQILFPPYTTN